MWFVLIYEMSGSATTLEHLASNVRSVVAVMTSLLRASVVFLRSGSCRALSGAEYGVNLAIQYIIEVF
jgi:hypothetical protein